MTHLQPGLSNYRSMKNAPIRGFCIRRVASEWCAARGMTFMDTSAKDVYVQGDELYESPDRLMHYSRLPRSLFEDPCTVCYIANLSLSRSYVCFAQ